MKKKSRDENEMAFDVLSHTIKAAEKKPKKISPAVRAAARALSKLGASKGGLARAEELSPERRREIAQKAAKAMWDKRRNSTP